MKRRFGLLPEQWEAENPDELLGSNPHQDPKLQWEQGAPEKEQFTVKENEEMNAEIEEARQIEVAKCRMIFDPETLTISLSKAIEEQQTLRKMHV